MNSHLKCITVGCDGPAKLVGDQFCLEVHVYSYTVYTVLHKKTWQ